VFRGVKGFANVVDFAEAVAKQSHRWGLGQGSAGAGLKWPAMELLKPFSDKGRSV
jgi:hypothetical protein